MLQGGQFCSGFVLGIIGGVCVGGIIFSLDNLLTGQKRVTRDTPKDNDFAHIVLDVTSERGEHVLGTRFEATSS